MSVFQCVLTTASISSDRRMSFSTWSAFDCIWAISKARLLAWFLQGEGRVPDESTAGIRLLMTKHFSVPLFMCLHVENYFTVSHVNFVKKLVLSLTWTPSQNTVRGQNKKTNMANTEALENLKYVGPFVLFISC